jgi:thiol-disulfide isomerase/thioredoxin
VYVVIDLAPVRLGPLALDGERALVALALAALLVAAELAARRRGGDAEWAWSAVAVGLLVARGAWVAVHPGAFLARPQEILYVWQGGFLAWVGVAAGAAWALWRARAAGRSIRVLATPALAAAATTLAASVVLPTAPSRPALAEVEVEVVDLAGRPQEVAGWRGRPTVLNLWATWCGPCRRELPLLIDEVGGRDDVRLALVSQAEAPEVVRGYLEERGLAGNDVWLDRAGALGRAMEAVGLPTTVFLDDEGRVVEVAFGEVSRARLRAALARIVSPGPGEGGSEAAAAGARADRSAAAEEPGGGAVRTLGGSLAGG